VSAKHGLRVGVIAILHTFNGKLEFNSHVHTMITGGGLHGSSGIWSPRVYYDKDRLMKAWQKAVIALLLRLVHRLERSRVGTLLSKNRRLPRWVARGSSQPEPGSGINSGLLTFSGGDALGAKYAGEF
jgi:Putative transposase